LTRVPPALHEISPGLPRTLSDLIMRCLAKDPSARPQTADEILQELDAMTMPMGITPQRGGVERRPSRRWTSIAAVAILFAVLSGVGYVVTRSPTKPAASATATKQSGAGAATRADSLRPPAAPVVAAPPAVAIPVPRPIISHDDSVKIAAAVAKKVAAARSADSVAKAKLAAETQRKMIDSIIAANSGGTAGTTAVGPRRVVIAEPGEVRGWPEAPLLGQAVSDSLRRMLRARPRQFALVDQDSVRTLLLRTRDVAEIARNTNSDLMISIRLTPTRNDSAMMMMQIYDLTAANQFRSRAAAGRQLPKNEVLGSLDQVLLSTMTLLDEMTRAPRRPPPPTSPTTPNN
jgi:hypothetical protein